LQLHTYVTDNHLRALAVVEKHLASNTFLVNERITAADILLAQTVQLASTLTLGKEERVKFPNVFRHFETISNQPEIKPVFGETAFVDKPAVFTPPKKEKAPADSKPKAEKPKAEPKPKAEKKPKDDEDDDEPLVPEEPKAKNPLDDLPKSTLNLEDWKRAYSNMETRGDGGAIEWFYKKCVGVS
jgi:elongation factor 1-gamma